MIPEAVYRGEFIWTLVAGVVLFARVSAQMDLQQAGLDKRLATEAALVGTNLAVHLLRVDGQFGAGEKVLIAGWTLEVLDSLVPLLMLQQVRVVLELLSAVVAAEIGIRRVRDQVNGKAPTGIELDAADLAKDRLCCMNPSVACEGQWCLVGFSTDFTEIFLVLVAVHVVLETVPLPVLCITDVTFIYFLVLD